MNFVLLIPAIMAAGIVAGCATVKFVQLLLRDAPARHDRTDPGAAAQVSMKSDRPGNWPVAAALIIAERTGRAIRRPAVEAMLSHAGKWGLAEPSL